MSALTLAAPTTVTNEVVFTGVVAAGGTTPYSYQWYKSTTANFTPSSSNIISGQTTSLLAVQTTVEAETYYTCVVTDSTTPTASVVNCGYIPVSAPPLYVSGTLNLGKVSHAGNATITHYQAGTVVNFYPDLTAISGGYQPNPNEVPISYTIHFVNQSTNTVVTGTPTAVITNGVLNHVTYTLNGSEMPATATYTVYIKSNYLAGTSYTSQTDSVAAA